MGLLWSSINKKTGKMIQMKICLRFRWRLFLCDEQHEWWWGFTRSRLSRWWLTRQWWRKNAKSGVRNVVITGFWKRKITSLQDFIIESIPDPYWISAYSSIPETCPCSICLLRCSPLSLLDLCDSGYFSGHRSSSLWTQCSVFLHSLSSPWDFPTVMSGSSLS